MYMNRIIQSLILTLLLLTSCNCEENTADQFKLGIDVQASFDNDHVIVTVDQHEVINQLVTTNHLLGVTQAREIESVAKGDHTITVIVNDSITKTEQFRVLADTFIGINFNSDGVEELHVTYSATPFGYD
jgi:hypothetical protein